MTESGIGLRIENDPRLSTGDLLAIASAAEAAGMNSVWVPEGGGRDAISLLAAMAIATDRVKLATGILPVFSRSPTATAMSAAGLAAVSDNRFILGLGSGHRPVVTDTHGLPYSDPIGRMTETVRIAQGLLQGRSVSSKGSHFTVSGARLGRAAQGLSVPIYLAALGPRMIGVAGQFADGALFNWTAADSIAGSVATLRSAAEQAGRDPGSVRAAGYVRTAIARADDQGPIREALRRQVAGYANHFYYRRFFESTGFGREMKEARSALAAGDRAAAAQAVSIEMQNQVAVVGSASQCRAEIARRRRLGLDEPVLAPFAAGPDVKGAYLRVIDAFAGRGD